MYLCHICGNEISPANSSCPFCGNAQDSSQQAGYAKNECVQKIVNLEQGLPTVDTALQRLQREISTAKMEKVCLLTLIHGYGASGKGGAIRKESRKTLDYLCQKGEINAFIPGEEFHRRHGQTKHLVSRYPVLANHPYIGQQNKGITVVVVS